MKWLSLVGTLAMTIGTGCVHRLPTSWRLSQDILSPPGTAGSAMPQATTSVEAPQRRPTCAPNVQFRRGHARVTIRKADLTNKPPGWLTDWTENLEAQGCIEPGEATLLANRIAESLPMEMNSAFHLLYPTGRGTVELSPRIRLQVMTPITAEGTSPDAPVVEVQTVRSGAAPNTLNVDARFSAAILGYEMAWYSIQGKIHAAGFSIRPVVVERYINGNIERAMIPAHNYFQALNAASFFRLFYKGGETGFTAVIVAGTSKADLDARTKLVEAGSASCESPKDDFCVTIPKRIGINPMIAVKLNGAEVLLNWGATVRRAIASTGERQPVDVLSRLSISKPYRDGSALVEFDHTDPTILDLILMGGESLSWQ